MDAVQRRMELMSLSPDYVGSGLVGGRSKVKRGKGKSARGAGYIDDIIDDINIKQNKILKDIKSLNKDKKLLESYDDTVYGSALSGGRRKSRGGCDTSLGGSKNDAWQVHIRRTLRAHPNLASDRPKLLKVASKSYKKKK